LQYDLLKQILKIGQSATWSFEATFKIGHSATWSFETTVKIGYSARWFFETGYTVQHDLLKQLLR